MKIISRCFLLTKFLLFASIFSCSDSGLQSFSFTAVRSYSEFSSDYSKLVSDSVNLTLPKNKNISAWKVTPISVNSCEVVVIFKKGVKPTDRDLQRIQELVMSGVNL